MCAPPLSCSWCICSSFCTRVRFESLVYALQGSLPISGFSLQKPVNDIASKQGGGDLAAGCPPVNVCIFVLKSTWTETATQSFSVFYESVCLAVLGKSPSCKD